MRRPAGCRRRRQSWTAACARSIGRGEVQVLADVAAAAATTAEAGAQMAALMAEVALTVAKMVEVLAAEATTAAVAKTAAET